MAGQILPEGKSHSTPVRAALYARVSTANNGQDPTMQTRELREYCERRNWKVTGEYVDAGVSGTKESRPELNRLMADAHRRRFDAVVVWRFDRFARSVSHLLRALEAFKALGIEFVSLSEQVDTSTPTGKMVFTVLGAVAEQPDRRASKSWPPERPGQGKAPRKATCSRGCRHGCRPARTRALVARNHRGDGN
jgi:hypothetical protein